MKNIDDLFNDTENYFDENPNSLVDENSQIILIDLHEINNTAIEEAKLITERLSAYYFDQKYLDNHPYIPVKIANEMNNIRRLLKMLSINEKAQDALIMNISINAHKAALYSALTSLQNSILNIQNQLNSLTSDLEAIFSEMQAECDKTFEQKEKDVIDDGSVIVRGSREFINSLKQKIDNTVLVNTKTGEIANL